MNPSNRSPSSSTAPSIDYFMYNLLYNRKAMQSVGIYICDDNFAEEHSDPELGIEPTPQEEIVSESVPEPVLNFAASDSNELESLKCDECGIYFKHKSALERHKFWTHSDQEYRCANCGRRFCNEGLLNRHIDNRICVDRKYRCNICGKEYVNKKHIVRHIREHGAYAEPISFSVIERSTNHII